MKVLLTGATGFVGSWIARELVAAGHELRILVRKTSKLDNLTGLVCEKVEGDINEMPSVERALEGMQALIHSAGKVSQSKRDFDLVMKVNVEGTRTVLAAAAKRPGIRVVHTSSIAAIGATKEPSLMDENSPWTVADLNYGYVTSKRLAEGVVYEFVERGLDAVILNPGWVLGPNDPHVGSTRMVFEYINGIMRWGIKGGLSFCDVRDVAKAHVTALARGGKGERYIVAGINATYLEVLETLSRITGLPRPLLASRTLAMLIGTVSEAASLLFKHRFEDVNRTVIRYGHLYNFCDVNKAERDLGYSCRSLEQTLRDTVQDFLKRGLIPATTKSLRDLAGTQQVQKAFS